MLRRLVRVGDALLLISAAASPVAAQQRDTLRADIMVFRIGEIRVQARRPVTTVGGASAVEVTLDSLALSAAPTVEEVLREIPTVHVRTNSRGEAEISVRGSESRQVAILLDGVPLTLGWDARTDVSVLPAGAIQELNLVRGVSSVLHGPNVLGGVVEVGVGRSTRVPLRRVGGELTLQAVELVDPATTLSREPENLPGRSGNVYARLPLAAGWTLGAEARYTGSQFCQDLNTGADVRLPAGTWVNGDLARVWSLPTTGGELLTHLETRISVDNLTDTVLYDQCGLPRPGRLTRSQIRVF